MNEKNNCSYKINEESYIEYMTNLLEKDKERFIVELCSQIKKLHEDLSKGKCSNEEDCYNRYLDNKKRYLKEVLKTVKKTDEFFSILAKWGGWIITTGLVIYNFLK